MSLLALIRKRDAGNLATAIPAIPAIPAISATQSKGEAATVARIATVAVANPAEAFDYEAFEERAAICEFDGGLSREEAEAIAWLEDDRRRCAHCLNMLVGGVCKVATPGGLVSAIKGYRPNQGILLRCAGYRPCPDDPDQRLGRERWPEFRDGSL